MNSKDLTESSQEKIESKSVVLIVAAAFFLTGLIIYLSKNKNKLLLTDPPIIIKTGYEDELKHDLTKFIVEINKRYTNDFDEVHSGNHYDYIIKKFGIIQKTIINKNNTQYTTFADVLGLTIAIGLQEGGPGNWDDVNDTTTIKTDLMVGYDFVLRIDRKLDNKSSNPSGNEYWENDSTNDPLRISYITVFNHEGKELDTFSSNNGDKFEIEFYN